MTFRSFNLCPSRTIDQYIQFNTLKLQLFYTTRKQDTGKGNGHNHITEKVDLTHALFAFYEFIIHKLYI